MLRPALGARVVFFVLAVALLALSAVGVFFNPISGVLGVLIFGFATVNATLRLFHPRSYATELSEHGFRVFDSLGRLVHDVAWAEVAHLTMFNGNGLRGPGSSLLLAWRCDPRRRGPGRQPWAHGGHTATGEEFDGALPSAYLGIERMLELFKQRADAANVVPAAHAVVTTGGVERSPHEAQDRCSGSGPAWLALERHGSVLRRSGVAGGVMGIDGELDRRLAMLAQRLLDGRERLAGDRQLDLALGAPGDRAVGQGLERVALRLAVG
jgi:hypothetical protein